MAGILRLDEKNYDLWLTYSWSENNHGICGHTFEVLDYFLFLKNIFKVGILLAEDIDWELFKRAICSKYDVSEAGLAEIKSHTVFFNRPSLVQASNILITDGGVSSLRGKLIIRHKTFYFSCGDKGLQSHSDKNTHVLQDERIYGQCFNSINYKKKINFSRYKRQAPSLNRDYLLYATKNCRDIPRDLYSELLNKYEGDFLCLTNRENRPQTLSSPRLKFLDLPVEDLFGRFGTYIYTPVPRKFDCSPRLIAECKFYGKEVIYHGIDYWDEDGGLYWRKWDIDNDFESLSLTESDEIISILEGHL